MKNAYNRAMRSVFAFVALLAWALWLGGLVTLFVCVSTLFRTDRAIATQAAPQLFVAFERYQLIVAAFALTSTFAWRVSSRITLLNMAFFLLGLSALGAVASPMYFTRRMEALREEGKINTPEFKTLHGRSFVVYTGEVIVLLMGGVALFTALRRSPAQPQIKSA